jgi:hypothetical protein
MYPLAGIFNFTLKENIARSYGMNYVFLAKMDCISFQKEFFFCWSPPDIKEIRA